MEFYEIKRSFYDNINVISLRIFFLLRLLLDREFSRICGKFQIQFNIQNVTPNLNYNNTTGETNLGSTVLIMSSQKYEIARKFAVQLLDTRTI